MIAIIRNKFWDPEQEALITVIGDYVVTGSPIDGKSYIDFQHVIDPNGETPYCETWAEGGMTIEQAKQVIKELEEAIQYLEGSE